MKSWTQTHDAHRGLTMLMATQPDEPRCAADSGVVTARAWGVNEIVLKVKSVFKGG
jgi:hypothetical protein